MKVLHLIPRFVVSRDGVLVGSAANTLRNLILSTNVHFSSEIYTHIDKGMKGNLCKLEIDEGSFHIGENVVQPHSLIYGFWFLFRGLYKIIRYRAWNADIIHGHSGYPIYGLLTATTAKLLGKKSLHTVYCPITERAQVLGRKHFLNKKLFSYWALRLNNKILAISENVKKSILEIGIPSDKISVIPPIIDFNRFNPGLRSNELRNELGANDNEPIITFIGNLKHSKGIDILIEALGILVSDKIKFIFVVTLDDLINEAANQKLMKFKERIKSLKLTNRTRIFGFVPNIPRLMASIDILVMPFRDMDGPSDCPMVLLEAMASGTPLVTTKVGGIPELIENKKNGFLVEKEKIIPLAHAIQTLLADQHLRHSIGKTSRLKAEKLFSSENLLNNILTNYKNLIKSVKVNNEDQGFNRIL